jgi:hypothetical protein
MCFWKFRVFFNHARAFVARFGTLYHCEEDLLGDYGNHRLRVLSLGAPAAGVRTLLGSGLRGL